MRHLDLAGLVERTPPQRLRTAIVAQLSCPASKTRLDTYPEVAAALDRIHRGLPVDCDQDGPLGLRMRTLAAEVHATRQLLRDDDTAPCPTRASPHGSHATTRPTHCASSSNSPSWSPRRRSSISGSPSTGDELAAGLDGA
ncbi:hypothetical protein [Streptomyces sp. DG1A-41]|uniref:hypothetical protein n=1 Tax=Streptomyces sp. DG1A-41 TaxID=3125779 RepID=UPI0030CEF790